MAVRAAAEGLTWRRFSCLRLQSVMAEVGRRECGQVASQQDAGPQENEQIYTILLGAILKNGTRSTPTRNLLIHNPLKRDINEQKAGTKNINALRQQKVSWSCREGSKFRPAPSSTHDWIGPPNPLSNLRPVIYRVPENESELEGRLRTLRQATEDWNHRFWTTQNLSFSKDKDAFIASELKVKGLSERDEQGRRRALSSEEMAVFYKRFLDINKERHANYNKEWYRRNFAITFLMARVTLGNLWRSVANKHNRSQT